MNDRVRRNLPNSLTILRLLLAAAFFAALNMYRYPDTNVIWAHIAIGLFILAVITDALDGYLARRWEVVSAFGRLMDPFCDKVLIMGAFVYLAGPRFVIADADSSLSMATGVYQWMVVVILARELLVTGIRGVIESSGVSFGSMLSGKLKMILQSFVIPIVLLIAVAFEPGKNVTALWINHILSMLTLVVTVWSGIPYLQGMRAFMRDGVPGAGQ